MALERLTEVPLQRVYLDSGTQWGENDPDGSSDDHALVTARLREVLLHEVLCWSRACDTAWPMVMRTTKGHGGAVCRAV